MPTTGDARILSWMRPSTITPEQRLTRTVSGHRPPAAGRDRDGMI
jgi:hypothetical protein